MVISTFPCSTFFRAIKIELISSALQWNLYSIFPTLRFHTLHMLAKVMLCLPSSAYNSIFVLLRYEDDHYIKKPGSLKRPK